MTDILSLLGGAISLLVKFFDWLHERNLVESGKTQEQLDSLRGQIHGVQIAIAAREAVRADVMLRDGKLPEHDPFLRD